MRYRVDYFLTDYKHIKRFFFTYNDAYRFACRMSRRTDVKDIFILECVDMEDCIYDVMEKI